MQCDKARGNNKLSTMKLDSDQFSSALKKGLGRAMLHIMHYGLDNVQDLVLDACLHNYCYDTQLESSRASWLFRMFVNSEYYSKFSETVLDRLKKETETDNLAQLCGLAKEMAAYGNKIAWRQLREIVFEKASAASPDDWMGAYEWIELEGTMGFLDLARIYGQRLLRDPDDFVPDNVLHLGKTENEIKDVLFQFAEQDVDIRAYKNYLEERGVFRARSESINVDAVRKRRNEEIRQKYTLKSIMDDARKKIGDFPGRYMTFGRHATTDELEKVYSQLFIETDKDVLLRLLWVFRRAPLPRLAEPLFSWAEGEDEELRRASINALAQISNEQVRKLAISKVRVGKLLGPDNDALDLFINNLEDDDILLITQALGSLKPDSEDAHSLGFSLLELGEKHSKIELANTLKWTYENTPCANCRHRAIEQLYEWQKLDDEILYESQFDAEEDIRNFAKEKLADQHK